MDPNQNQPATSGMDYLDHIAAKPPSRFSFINRKILIAGVAVLVLLISLIIANAVVGNRGASQAATLNAQFSSLSTLVAYGPKNKISDSDLNKAVADATLTLASAKNQLSKAVTLPKPTADLTAAEGVSKTIAALDAAKSSGNQSGEYSAALRDKIDSIIVSLTSLRDALGANGQKIVDQQIANFTELNTRL